MKHHYKRDWDESTGEELTDAWGTSTFYFETDDQMNVIRQVQVFEEGQVLKYDTGFMDDDFGGLADQQLDREEFDEFSISEDEFNETWNKFEIQG